jgi:predicted ATPase
VPGSLLRTEGIVSVVGLGGIGKTRLAIQLAFDVMDGFPDGAWLVELAPLSDPASVARAVAEATRVAELEAAGEVGILTTRHRTWFALRVERVESEIGRTGSPRIPSRVRPTEARVIRSAKPS